MTKLPLEKACEFLRDLCDTVVIMMGKEGCLIGHGADKIRMPAFEMSKPVDSTGAGDLFISGFLHGLLRGDPLEKCAFYGTIAGSAIIKEIGAELSKQGWEEVKKKINDLGVS